MYCKYTLFCESPKNWDITCMRKQCVPGLSSGGEGPGDEAKEIYTLIVEWLTVYLSCVATFQCLSYLCKNYT